MNRSIIGCMLIQSQNVLTHISPSFLVPLLSLIYFKNIPITQQCFRNGSLFNSIGGLFGGKVVSVLSKYLSYRQYLFLFCTANMILCFFYHNITNHVLHFIIFFFTGCIHNSIYYMSNHIGKYYINFHNLK